MDLPSLDRLAPDHPVNESMAGVFHPVLGNQACRDEDREQQATADKADRDLPNGHSGGRD